MDCSKLVSRALYLHPDANKHTEVLRGCQEKKSQTKNQLAVGTCEQVLQALEIIIKEKMIYSLPSKYVPRTCNKTKLNAEGLIQP